MKNKNIKFISLLEANKLCDYSQEYLSLRARQGKLKSRKLGRNWYTTEEWLKEYLSNPINNSYKKESKEFQKKEITTQDINVIAKMFNLRRSPVMKKSFPAGSLGNIKNNAPLHFILNS